MTTTRPRPPSAAQDAQRAAFKVTGVELSNAKVWAGRRADGRPVHEALVAAGLRVKIRMKGRFGDLVEFHVRGIDAARARELVGAAK